MSGQLSIILVPHTHWDREWYLTFQQFRIRLVQTVDKLLNIMEHDPGFKHFMLDGQTIVLEDYLEVQPEQEERLKRYIAEGRILVGPWYLQPDEFLVGGESLIRNLQTGLRQAARFGEPMRVGYLPDCFGHIAQMPQILRGFGIDSAVLWRGVGDEVKGNEFYWEAPDGSRVLVIYLPEGYGNARLMPLRPEAFVTRLEQLLTPLLDREASDTLLLMNGSDHLEPQQGLPATIEEANRLLDKAVPRSQNGHNHYEGIHIQIGTIPQYIEHVRRQIEQRDWQPTTLKGELRSSKYAHLLPAVLSTRMWIKQQNTALEHLLQYWVEPLTLWAWRLGADYPQGLIQLAWKYLLQNQPHDSICGCSIDQVHRENSVRFAQSQQIGEALVARALQQVTAAIDTRPPYEPAQPEQQPFPIVVFNMAPGPRTAAVAAAIHTAESLERAALLDEQGRRLPYRVLGEHRRRIGSQTIQRQALARLQALGTFDTPGRFLALAHDTIRIAMGVPDDPDEFVDLRVLPTASPELRRIEISLAPSGLLAVDRERLLAAEAEILALLQQEEVRALEFEVFELVQQKLEFLAADLPPYGVRSFWLYPAAPRETGPAITAGTLLCGERSIENEFYRVEVEEEAGTLTVTDKRDGSVFKGLNRFVDGGDVGDLYTYCPPARDQLISRPAQPPHIELINGGPVRATLRISALWQLPATCSSARDGRSEQLVDCQICSEVSLYPGVRRIDIHTTVENNAKDHRLRVLFPVSYTIEKVAAEGTFEVRLRPVTTPHPENVSDWAEAPVNTFPQKRFVDLSDGRTGLAVLNRGLPEYEVLQSGPGLAPGQMALALTLLRCVEWLSRDDLSTRQGHAGPMEYTPEAQCPGRHEFDYALVPHRGSWDAEEGIVLREAQAFNLPARAMVSGQHDGQLRPSTSLIEIAPPELVLSALKRSLDGQGWIARVYNPLDHAVEAVLRPGLACQEAFVANLLEEARTPLTDQDVSSGSALPQRSIRLPIRAGEIVTVLFR
jgi:alpha-mannosidase